MLAATDVQSFAAIWQERRDTVLKNSAALKQFNERLAREWAIETGIIEGLYTIDRGTTRVLIEQGIIASLIPHGATDKPAGRIVDILNDHQSTLEGIFDFIGRQRDLSTSYIKEVHAALTQHQPTTEAIDALGRRVDVDLIRGDWKQLANSPTRPDGGIHQYAPPEHAAAEMDRLVALHGEHDEVGVSPEVEAAWLHHRFTQIHPFQDGNGRVARVLASLVFLRAGWFPLVVTRDDRTAYIGALESADAGDLSPLVVLFAGMQKRRILQALSLSDAGLMSPTNAGTNREAMFSAIKEKLASRDVTSGENRMDYVFKLSKELVFATGLEFDVVTRGIRAVFPSGHPDSYSLSYQDQQSVWSDLIPRVAREYGYVPDTSVANVVQNLTINDENLTRITVHVHGLGKPFTGVLVALAIFTTRSEAVSITREPFSFAYNEEEADVLTRYKQWLDEVIFLGLNEWRKRL